MRLMSLLAVFAVTTSASAQPIEERAAQVRQTLEDRAADVRRTIDSPSPVETVIDRGTRVIAQPPPVPQATSPANPVTSRPATQGGVPTSAATDAPANRLLSPGTPGALVVQPDANGATVVVDPRSTARIGIPQAPGDVGLRNFPPGVLVTRGANNGQVTGASNLVTGNGTSPGVAP
jgi:hypothetical protein